MSDERVDRAAVAELLTVLDESVYGASGPSTYFVDNRSDAGLLGALGALSATAASMSVSGSSIAAHTSHLVFAMHASADWIEGDRRPRDWSESWRVQRVSDAQWDELVGEVRHAHARLRRAIDAGASVRTGAFGEAVGAIAHIAYHLGSVWQKIGVLHAG